MYLPDANVLVAAAFAGHEHHAAAARWFAPNPAARFSFCRSTQQAFLRIATTRSAFGDDTLTMSGAWRAYDTFLEDGRIDLRKEPLGLEPICGRFTEPFQFSPKVWNDAYLAAFAAAAGLTVVTFDNGFRQYAGVPVIVLTP